MRPLLITKDGRSLSCKVWRGKVLISINGIHTTEGVIKFQDAQRLVAPHLVGDMKDGMGKSR